MARFRVEGPDGRSYTVEAPKGASDSDVMAFLQSQMAAPKSKPVDAVVEDAKTIPWYQAAAIGTGRGMQDVIQGVKQIALGSKNMPYTSANLIAERVPALGQWMDKEAAKQKQQQADEAESFAKLSDASPVSAIGGRILGNVAAAPIPAARGGTLGATALNAAIAGAGSAGVQYVPEGGSRAFNMALGGAVGAALPAGIEAGKLTVANVKLLAGKMKAAMPNVSQAAREKAAAEWIRNAAANPKALDTLQESIIPGVQRNLAEATDDTGIAGMIRAQMSENPTFNNQMVTQAQANNAARVGAIRGAFGGADEGTARALEEARDKATLPLLKAARKVQGVNVSPVMQHIDNIIASRKGNATITGVLKQVKDAFSELDSNDVRTLHNLRQEIGYIIGGQSEKAGTAGPAAARELMSIRSALDSQIGKSSKEFRQFLRQYTDLSKEIGQVRIGDELLGKSGNVLDSSGNPVLSAHKFAGAANDLDRVAKAATGFKKETAERVMTPGQIDMVGNVRADLDRYARAQTGGKAIGSPTHQNKAAAERFQNVALGGELTQSIRPKALDGPGMAFFNAIRQHYGNKQAEIVEQMLANPRNAQRILAKYPPQVRQQVMTLLDDPKFQQFMRFSQEATPAPAGAASAAMFGQPQEPQQ